MDKPAAKRPLNVAVVIGTRPEAIKLAPIVLAARARAPQFRISVVRTGQHAELVDQLMDEFGLAVDVDLKIMRPNQELAHVMADSVRGLSDLFAAQRPDWVLVQGDTTTTFAGALAAFYNRAKIGHVEAGLRTGNRHSPFPEEANRVLTTRLADLHFAPTDGARQNLLDEGVDEDDVIVTGNTVIDALQHTLAIGRAGAGVSGDAPAYILVTVHRRENHGAALGRICDGLLAILERHPALVAWLPMHPSPAVRGILERRLRAHARVRLTEPLGYRDFIAALDGCTMVLSDSGGIQEECVALGKPVLVLRDDTERPEAVAVGVGLLVGSDTLRIAESAHAILADGETRRRMSQPSNAFGSGGASSRILDALWHDRPSDAPAACPWHPTA